MYLRTGVLCLHLCKQQEIHKHTHKNGTRTQQFCGGEKKRPAPVIE